jgi:hypothetical protein
MDDVIEGKPIIADDLMWIPENFGYPDFKALAQ